MVWGLAALVEGLLLVPLVVGLLEDWGVLKIAAALKNPNGKHVCYNCYYILFQYIQVQDKKKIKIQ